MSLATLFLLAFGLSMDAFAVSVSNGMCYAGYHRSQVLTSAFFFGLFQAGMPLLGYLGGRYFESYIKEYDHWVALLLLGYIGGAMLADAIREKNSPATCCERESYNTKAMLLQGVATSIDALAVGVSFAAIEVDILPAVTIIGFVTFACCTVGGGLGRRFGALLQHRAKLFGGLILIGIGLKIFLEHSLAA
ncbi:MAG TPA: manganese efflux pump MntP family protein [Terriglobales bacterium]|nr:manganese efflux pump MntP family protein [Terriglobales bacterium]